MLMFGENICPSSKKLKYIADKTKDVSPEQGKKNLKKGIAAILEGFKKRREVKSKNGDYIYLYTDWELVDYHVGLMINYYEWLPSKKEFREYNLLWKNYSNVRNLV